MEKRDDADNGRSLSSLSFSTPISRATRNFSARRSLSFFVQARFASGYTPLDLLCKYMYHNTCIVYIGGSVVNLFLFFFFILIRFLEMLRIYIYICVRTKLKGRRESYYEEEEEEEELEERIKTAIHSFHSIDSLFLTK